MRTLNAMESFSRDINYSCGIDEKGVILLTGTLRDRWHHIEVHTSVDPDNLTISSCQVQFNKSPTKHCSQAEKQLQHLVGEVIGKGLMRNITLATGGGEGCSNLRTILTGLLPLALNVKASAGYEDEQKLLDAIQEKLTGTCAGYPEGL